MEGEDGFPLTNFSKVGLVIFTGLFAASDDGWMEECFVIHKKCDTMHDNYARK